MNNYKQEDCEHTLLYLFPRLLFCPPIYFALSGIVLAEGLLRVEGTDNTEGNRLESSNATLLNFGTS